RPGNVFEGKMTALLGHSRMKHDLEQEITQFAAQIVHVVSADGVGDLVGFLDRIRRDRFEGLRNIPIATALRIAKTFHDREETVELLRHLRMIIYIMLNYTFTGLLPMRTPQ